MKISILGTATTKFGELWNISPRALAKEAMISALDASGLKAHQIDALFVGNMLSGILGNQANLGSLLVEELGVNIPAFRIEGACASGGLALHNAVNSLKAYQYRTALVLGIEKMTDHRQDEITNALMAAGPDEERLAGVRFPGEYASKAQFQFEVSISDVMKSSKVAEPLKLLDCCPISDGAAAVVITSDENSKKIKNNVYIAASEVATDTLSLHDRKSFTSLSAVVD